MEIKKFETGKTYLATGGAGNGTPVKIIKRTAKRATIEYWGKQKTVAIKENKNDRGELTEYLFILWRGLWATDTTVA